MKKLFQIIVIVLVSLLLCSKSCVDDSEMTLRQELAVKAARQDVREEFEMAYLDEESRYAAEMSAVQKLTDLADYISIYANTSLDSAFRNRAGEMIRDIFSTEDDNLPFSAFGKGISKNLTVRKFLEKGFGDNVWLVEVSFDSIMPQIPLSRSGHEYYEGSISGVQHLTYYTSSAAQTFDKKTITAKVIASRKVKVFGKDTLHIWQVCLGDMTVNE